MMTDTMADQNATMGGSVLIDMSNLYKRALVIMLSQRSALGIEINTGMRHSRRAIMADVRGTNAGWPNAFLTGHKISEGKGGGSFTHPDVERGQDGFLVWTKDQPETATQYAQQAGQLYMTPISWNGTKIKVWEDLDATIARLGGPTGHDNLKRRGSRPEINAAAARKHARRIAAILATLANS